MPHGNLQERWSKYSLAVQLGNVGAEVRRMLNWRRNNNRDQTERARDRALELLDLTIADNRWRRGCRELVMLREVVAAEGTEGQSYGISERTLDDYFISFALIARR